jgi:hypothetical protein
LPATNRGVANNLVLKGHDAPIVGGFEAMIHSDLLLHPVPSPRVLAGRGLGLSDPHEKPGEYDQLEGDAHPKT